MIDGIYVVERCPEYHEPYVVCAFPTEEMAVEYIGSHDECEEMYDYYSVGLYDSVDKAKEILG